MKLVEATRRTRVSALRVWTLGEAVRLGALEDLACVERVAPVAASV
jgi:hypothetical protein